MKKYLIGLLSLLALSVFGASTNLPLVLAWDASVDPSVTGYKMYYKPMAATNYTIVSVPPTNTIVLTNRVDGTVSTNMPSVRLMVTTGLSYTFYVTCTNFAGLESDPSNSVGYTVPNFPSPPPNLRIRMEWSTNLVTWIPLSMPDGSEMAFFRLKINNIP